KGISVSNLTVRVNLAESAVTVFSTCAHDKFSYAVRWVGNSIRVLRGEALIVMVMAVDHEFSPVIVECLPKSFCFGVVSVLCTRAKQGLVPVRQRASHVVVRQILP